MVKTLSSDTTEPSLAHAKSVEDLLIKAESDIVTFNFEPAIEHCQSALVLDPKNVKAIEMLASILIDIHDIEQAESLYLQAVELSPNEGYSKYLSLGQITEGTRSLEFYQKGISIISKMLEDQENTEPEEIAKDSSSPPLQRILSDTYCSVAELYMTDLCDEVDAEVNCENAVQQSIKVDDSNPDAYQCLANLRMIQGNHEEAKSQMTKSLSFWLPEALDENTSELNLPEFSSRIKTSQLLIELSMFEEATRVLERLVDEDDQSVVVWYLLGWANYIHGDIYKGNAYYYLKRAKETAARNGCDDDDMIQHVEELLEELSVDVKSDNEEISDTEVNDDIKCSSESDAEMET